MPQNGNTMYALPPSHEEVSAFISHEDQSSSYNLDIERDLAAIEDVQTPADLFDGRQEEYDAAVAAAQEQVRLTRERMEQISNIGQRLHFHRETAIQ